jgi:hypothetical protein
MVGLGKPKRCYGGAKIALGLGWKSIGQQPKEGSIMSTVLTGLAAVLVCIHISLLSAVSPAAAITAELANKCRDMAIKAHPFVQPGTHPYAAAEREFFTQCVAKNGQMSNSSPSSPSTPPATPNAPISPGAPSPEAK